MKKIALWTMFISSVFLASCSLISKKNKNPEEIIKDTQISFIENMQDNVFSKKQVDFDGSLKVNVKSPLGWWNAILTYNGQWSKEQSKVDWNLSWSFNMQWKSWSVNVSAGAIVTLDKIYLKLSSLKAQLPDPSLQAYISMAQLIINKWFYIKNTWAKSKQLTLNLKNVNLKEQFKKYSIFKVNKVIEDKKYSVSLNKDNLANIVYNISKEIDPTFSWTKQDILSNMKEEDLTWVLNIKWDGYFTFSWNSTNWLEVLPIKIEYLKDSFYIGTKTLIIDINKHGDKFNGTVGIAQAWVTLNIDWKLTKNNFEINISYNKDPVNANVSFIYNAKQIDKIDIKIPEDAVDLQWMIQNAFGGGLWWSTWLPTEQTQLNSWK